MNAFKLIEEVSNSAPYRIHMLLVVPHQRVDCWYISYGEKTSNAIIDNGNYYSVGYSTPDMSISVLHIGFTLKNMSMSSHFNKYRCIYSSDIENTSTISNLEMIERGILAGFKTDRRPVYRMGKIKESNTLNCFVNMIGVEPTMAISTLVPNAMIIMKVSGIWETDTEYGVIFKFFIPGKLDSRELGGETRPMTKTTHP